ncbi:MAG: phosphatase PAP2 family protein [Rhodospirillaceae bacterium]
MSLRLAYPLERVAHWDAALCVRCNRMSRRAVTRTVFRAASRLGDGVFWYALMVALLVVYGMQALHAVAHMMLVGLCCTALYKWLKRRTLRPRPYEVHPDIVVFAEPLDRFSFPSGHTLHAVAFSCVALAYYPALAPLLLPFTLLVALSRPILGLHYPSDVLAGAAIGALIAGVSLYI